MPRETLAAICVPGPASRPRRRPERVIADKGYPSKANRAWLREHGSRPRSRSGTTRSPTAAESPAPPSTSADGSRNATAAATSSNSPSASSSGGGAQPCAQTGPPATTTTRSAWPPPSTGSTPALATRPGRQGGTAWAGHRCGKGAIMCWCRMTLLPAARLAAARNYWLCTTTGCAPRRPRVPRTRPRCGEW